MRRISNKNYNKFTLVLLLAAFLVIGLLGWWKWAQYPASDTEEMIKITIAEGATVSSVADQLKGENLIRSSLVFKYLARSLGMEERIMPGEYLISAHMSPEEILELITVPQMPTSVRVTIPEGYTLKQIIKTFVEKGLATEQELINIVTSAEFPYAFLSDAPTGFHRLEGYLFPDTYFFDLDTSPYDLIDTMLKRFNEELTEERIALLSKANLSIHEWVTIASMVEREAVKIEEMPTIASVILNRLKINMPLQIDATVQYLLPETKEILTYDDLKIESPYNTYLHLGLPPGPIASPGLASLEAVLEPENTDYLFYVAKGDGYHAFAKTYNEHLINVSKYQ